MNARNEPADAIRRTLELIEQLSFSDRAVEARSFLTQIWPFISAGVDPVPDAGTVDVFAGVALGYLQLGDHPNAVRFATNALIVSPADMLAHAICPLPDRIRIVRHFLHHQQTGKAVALLEEILRYTPAAAEEVSFYRAVLGHVEAEAARSRDQSPPDGRGTLFNLVLWGERYVDKFLRFALPSLLAPGNVPALTQYGPVIFDIHTTDADRMRLDASPGIAALRQRARIDYTILPATLFDFKGTEGTPAPDRLFVAGAQNLSAIKAGALRADLTYVVTEGLYSDRHFAIAKDYLRDGYKAVLTSSLRARDSGIAALLDAHGKVTEEAIAIGAAPLVAYACANLNPDYDNLFIRADSGTVSQDVIALYFRTEEGFAGHTFQISPVLIAHEIIPDGFEPDYHTSDARLLAELARSGDPARLYKVVDTPSDSLFVVDLDSGSGSSARVFGAFPVTVGQCVRSLEKWCSRESDFDYFEWAFRQRFAFRCNPTHLPQNDVSESEAVSRFCDLFEKAQDGCRRTIRYFRGRSGDAC